MRIRGRRPVDNNYAKHLLEYEVRLFNSEIPFLKGEIQRLKESLSGCKESIVKCGNFEFVVDDTNECEIKKQIEDYEKLIKDYTRYLSDISSVFERMGWN